MIKLFILAGLFLSLKAFAGYECDFRISHSEDLRTTIGTGKLVASSEDMKSASIKKLVIESKTKKRTISVSINAFISGWVGEEELSFAVFRREEKKSGVKLELIGEKQSLRGNQEETFWFDSYKLDVSCSLT